MSEAPKPPRVESPQAARERPSAFRNEPNLDFSHAQEQEKFSKALEKARALFPIHAPLWIGADRIETKETIAVACPNQVEMVLGESSSAGIEEAERAVAAAREALPRWSRREAEERAGLLREAARRLRNQRRLLAAVEVFEAAKPWREADADVCEAIDFLEYYAAQMLGLAQPRRLQPEILGERNELLYAPLGVVAVIGPWNFPMAIPVGMMAAAVAAGNTVVWKPAEQSPLILHLVMECLRAAGFPPGVVNLLPGRGEVVGRYLVESPGVNMIVFTGSREVGLGIVEAAGRTQPGQGFVKRVVAEMGGKNALIVDSSADLDSAVPDVLTGAFGYSGQKCSACSRLIVLADVYDALLARLKEGVASLKIAPSWDPGCQIGPVIDLEARSRIERYIEIGKSEGRTLYLGDPGSLAAEGHFVPPAIFEGISPNDRLAREEIFGPVLAVLRAESFDHALDLANSTEYALTGAVHSRTLSNLEKARRHFECGNLYLNRGTTGALVGRQPFGGYRLSGIGSKAGGPDYLKQFLVARTVTENLMRHGFAPIERAAPSEDQVT